MEKNSKKSIAKLKLLYYNKNCKIFPINYTFFLASIINY